MEDAHLGAGKKNAARLKAHVVFVDESGFLLIPTVRRTWAPRGQTPLLRHWHRRDRVSAISGLSLSATRRCCGLYFQLHSANIRTPDVCDFLRALLRQLRGPLIIVWDNTTIHRGPFIRAVLRRHPRLRLVALPSYAPEVNPDEGIWRHAKAELANGRPDTVADLMQTVLASLTRLRRSAHLLRACIAHADLPLRLP